MFRSPYDIPLGFPRPTRQKAGVKLPARLPLALALAATLVLPAAVDAQLEGSDRGVPPIDSSSSFEVGGIDVDVVAADSEKARQEGWREAARKGRKALWAKTHGGAGGDAPALNDSALDAMVSGIVVEQEQIGPRRYIAT